jgi:hypothetical protein
MIPFNIISPNGYHFLWRIYIERTYESTPIHTAALKFAPIKQETLIMIKDNLKVMVYIC